MCLDAISLFQRQGGRESLDGGQTGRGGGAELLVLSSLHFGKDG